MKRKLWTIRVARTEATSPTADAEGDQPPALAQEERQNRFPGGAEGDADADLLLALVDELREHAIQAGHHHQCRQRGERPNQIDAEALVAGRVFESAFHRLEIVYRKTGRGLAHDAVNGLRQVNVAAGVQNELGRRGEHEGIEERVPWDLLV